MNYLLLILLTTLTVSQAADLIYLDGCTYSIDLYKEYLNLLWSSNDAHTLHIQAVYSLTSNNTYIPGHIYTYLSRSVALIPLFIRCKYPENIPSKSYLPFTQCSSTLTNYLTKKNYESTRTYLNRKTILSLPNVPLLYTEEYHLILFNCSFRSQSNIYQLKPNEIFKFRIEYENSINENLTSCQTCNQRTSICEKRRCRCRKGTRPLKLHQNKEFCIDTTPNCSYDIRRCLNSKSIQLSTKHKTEFFFLILIICSSFLFLLLLVLLWYLFRTNSSPHVLRKDDEDHSSNPSIFIINRHERTPSTVSTTDSVKLNDYQHSLANEYVSTFYEEEYPKIIPDRNNTDLVLILA